MGTQRPLRAVAHTGNIWLEPLSCASATGETIAHTGPPRAGWKRAWGILILIIGMQLLTYPE
jgi:hypothetical protein